MKLRKVYACILTLCMLVSMLPAFAADTDASCTHKWTEKVIKEANCTQTGLVKKTCELCGDFEYEKTPFKHGEGKEVVKDATCTKPETVGLYCEKCGELIGKVQEVGKALGHDLGKGTEKKADCAGPDRVEYTCKRCGETVAEAIEGGEAAKEHDWEAKIVPATCKTKGYEARVCKACGKVEKDKEGSHLRQGRLRLLRLHRLRRRDRKGRYPRDRQACVRGRNRDSGDLHRA